MAAVTLFHNPADSKEDLRPALDALDRPVKALPGIVAKADSRIPRGRVFILLPGGLDG